MEATFTQVLDPALKFAFQFSSCVLGAHSCMVQSLGPCTHEGNPEGSPGSEIWTGSEPTIAATWAVKPADRRAFTLSFLCKSDFTVKKKKHIFFKKHSFNKKKNHVLDDVSEKRDSATQCPCSFFMLCHEQELGNSAKPNAASKTYYCFTVRFSGMF